MNQTATDTYRVTVHGRVVTEHQVTMQSEYVQRLTQGKLSLVVLIERSFEFLLAREPNTSILRSFDLSLISDYFADFEESIKQTCNGRWRFVCSSIKNSNKMLIIKKPAIGRLFYYLKYHYFSFVSLYITCLRTTGSNFLISIFPGIVRLFLVVV